METPETSAPEEQPTRPESAGVIVVDAGTRSEIVEALERATRVGEALHVVALDAGSGAHDAEQAAPIRIGHAEPAAPPVQNAPASVVPATEEHAGKLCYVCGDEQGSAPFALGAEVVIVPTTHGELLQHPLCFYVSRSVQLEAALAEATKRATDAETRFVESARGLAATHRTLCSVVAKTGRITVWQHNFERAAKCAFKLDIKRGPDDSTTLSLVGARIEVVQSVPEEG